MIIKSVIISTVTLLLIINCLSSTAQTGFLMNFEWSFDPDRLVIDSNSTTSWQVGSPHKDRFTSSFSEPNSIMTDTVNSVAAGDTIMFYLKHLRDNTAPFHDFGLQFWYQLDGDSLDLGEISISPDNGLNWVNIMSQDTIYDMTWFNPKPKLCGSTEDWVKFHVNMYQWATAPYNYPLDFVGDTVLFRFVYLTDTSTTVKDGWIIDDIIVNDEWEGTRNQLNENLLKVFPNPANNTITISWNDENLNRQKQVGIYSGSGKLLQKVKDRDLNELDISHLPNGMLYFLFSTEEEYIVKSIVKR